MVRIAPVKLQYNPRTLWFEPGDLDISAGSKVIVSTQRGKELGTADGIIEVEEEQLKCLKSPLKPVVRVATQEDLDKFEELQKKGQEALPKFKQVVEKSGKKMRPVLVEYLFGEDKAVFYFEAEERVDFRDMVRDLAKEFHVRIDMRQIGVRDEARLVGGLGHCGQELCCKRLGGEFNHVSIRMAKEQDLSLNPVKISGVCGRLMCCLCYEYDAYKEFHERCPKVNAKITTPEGPAKVTSLDVPRERVTISVEETRKRHTFPLSAFDPAPEGTKRPNTIGEDAYDEYTSVDPFVTSTTTGIGILGGAKFTGIDKLGAPVATHNPRSAKPEKGQDGGKRDSSRKPRRRKNKGSSNASGAAQKDSKAASDKQKGQRNGDQSAKRKRRSRGGKSAQNKQSESTRQNQNKNGAPNNNQSMRPGRKSSNLRQGQTKNKNTAAVKGDGASNNGDRRRTRRRSHTSGGDGNEG